MGSSNRPSPEARAEHKKSIVKKEKTRITVTIDKEMHSILARIAYYRGISISAVIREYLDIGRESLSLIAQSLQTVALVDEDERERIRLRLDVAAGQVAVAEREALRLQESLSEVALSDAEALERWQQRSETSASPAIGPGQSDPDPRVVTRGFPATPPAEGEGEP